jgi:hypothetical protein
MNESESESEGEREWERECVSAGRGQLVNMAEELNGLLPRQYGHLTSCLPPNLIVG